MSLHEVCFLNHFNRWFTVVISFYNFEFSIACNWLNLEDRLCDLEFTELIGTRPCGSEDWLIEVTSAVVIQSKVLPCAQYVPGYQWVSVCSWYILIIGWCMYCLHPWTLREHGNSEIAPTFHGCLCGKAPPRRPWDPKSAEARFPLVSLKSSQSKHIRKIPKTPDIRWKIETGWPPKKRHHSNLHFVSIKRRENGWTHVNPSHLIFQLVRAQVLTFRNHFNSLLPPIKVPHELELDLAQTHWK